MLLQPLHAAAADGTAPNGCRSRRECGGDRRECISRRHLLCTSDLRHSLPKIDRSALCPHRSGLGRVSSGHRRRLFIKQEFTVIAAASSPLTGHAWLLASIIPKGLSFQRFDVFSAAPRVTQQVTSYRPLTLVGARADSRFGRNGDADGRCRGSWAGEARPGTRCETKGRLQGERRRRLSTSASSSPASLEPGLLHEGCVASLSALWPGTIPLCIGGHPDSRGWRRATAHLEVGGVKRWASSGREGRES